MIIRSGSTKILSPSAVALAQDIPKRGAERSRIVKRLKAIVATHVEASARFNVPLGVPDLLAVISALLAHADGLNSTSILSGGDEISTHLRQSLFEELLGEPSNIFFTTKVSEDVVRYEALPKEFWKECLNTLSSEITTLKPHHQ